MSFESSPPSTTRARSGCSGSKRATTATGIQPGGPCAKGWPTWAATNKLAEEGRGANQRYLEALSAASDHGEAVKALDDLCRPTIHNQRRTAGFNPATRSDLALFKAVVAGEHAVVGFRNDDLTNRLYPRPPSTEQEARRRSARTSRLITKLRGHGLVTKVKD